MDVSCESDPLKDEQLMRSSRTGNASEIVHKPLTFGVDRILASDKTVRNEVPHLHQMQFLINPHDVDMNINHGIIGAANGLLINKQLIRPQPIRITESNMNGRGQLLNNDAVNCQPLGLHRFPIPSASAMLHNHLPMIRFYPLPQKYRHHQQFLVQQHYNVGGEAQRSGESIDHDRITQSHNQTAGQPTSKRKRSWSRAVFSNLQRKGLEIAFGGQKYITKPDRRKLAARLGLTDAQVKVWFQNRRMKWRHTGEDRKSGVASGQPISKTSAKGDKCSPTSEVMFTSSDDESSCEDEIDVTD